MYINVYNMTFPVTTRWRYDCEPKFACCDVIRQGPLSYM